MTAEKRQGIPSTKRFDGRADVYSRYRPRYPEEALRILEREFGFYHKMIVTDIGSGTGILSKLFLENGNTVYGVEPNGDMRGFAEKNLKRYLPRFISVIGTAEATGLRSRSVDLVTAGQALHWFDAEKARNEFRRILKPSGHLAVAYNTRRNKCEIEEAYQRLRDRFADRMADTVDVDYAFVSRFLGNSELKKFTIHNTRTFDYKGMLGLLASASYMPSRGSPEWKDVEKGVRKIFRGRDDRRKLPIHYETTLYVGQITTG